MPRYEIPDVRGEYRDIVAPVVAPDSTAADALAAAILAQGAAAAADTKASSALASMPQPATSAPPAVQVDSSQGAGARYAREDHTHQSRLQARRLQVTPNASGQYVYTFPLPYDTGIVPIIQVTCETPTGQTYRYDAGLLQGSTTNTQTTIVITKTNQNVVTGLLNAVLAVFTPATSALWINIMSRAPS